MFLRAASDVPNSASLDTTGELTVTTWIRKNSIVSVAEPKTAGTFYCSGRGEAVSTGARLRPEHACTVCVPAAWGETP